MAAQEEYTNEQAAEDIGALIGQVDALNEVLTQTDSGTVPNTPAANSFSLFSQAGQPQYVNDSGLQMGLVGAQQAFFPVNTVTAALPTLTSLASMTIPANDAIGGAVYELEVWGSGTQASGARVSLEFAVVLGGNTMSTVQFGTTAWEAVSQSFRWVAVGRVINHTTGAGGTWSSYLLVTTADAVNNIAPGNNDFATAFSCEIASTTTVDTTVSETFGLSAGWSTATGSPTMTSRVALPKRWC